MGPMRRAGWFAWFGVFLLFVALGAAGPHVHDSGVTHDRDCATCTLAHTPVAPPADLAAPPAPQPTRERAVVTKPLRTAPPPLALPSWRAPPLG
jgi:hypothetical protein